ncbi:hypothetical protein ACFYO0_07600 [Streptomyces sp. NPDC006365]|uniref:hypothetical protein n=1 Tax=Streptomyces sp. NPDC006365 TaxID=3364744 RepID=UPI003676E411
MSKVWSVAGSSRDIGREFAVAALECREPLAARSSWTCSPTPARRSCRLRVTVAPA